jgi:hypothetical protein
LKKTWDHCQDWLEIAANTYRRGKLGTVDLLKLTSLHYLLLIMQTLLTFSTKQTRRRLTVRLVFPEVLPAPMTVSGNRFSQKRLAHFSSVYSLAITK